MILIRVIPSTKDVTMLSIPRDLYAHLSTGGYGKIDGAYSYGGPGAAIATVEQDFGVHIDDYIWVGLLGLVKLIDAIGGIGVVARNPVIGGFSPPGIYGGVAGRHRRGGAPAGPPTHPPAPPRHDLRPRL